MKIIFFSQYFYPHIGGVETHILEISKELIKLGHDVLIICEDKTGILPKKEIFLKIKICRIPLINISEKKKKFHIWAWLFSNISILKSSDLIHIHDVGYWIFPIFFLIHRKVFITFHGYEGSNPPNLRTVIQRKLILKMTKKSINVGTFMEKWYKYIPNAIIYGATRNILKTRINKKKQAIYIGRLHEDTGIMVYLKSLVELKNNGINLYLDVFGDGDLRKNAEKFASKNKLNVRFYGFSEDVAKKIVKYRYACVSRYLSILEAMRAKVPVLAVYNNQIKKDYLDCHPMRENFFATNDPKKLAVQLIKLQKPDAETKAQVERAYQWAKKQTWEALTKVYLNLWGI